MLDARKATADAPANNLTPRALILNVGNDVRIGFDIDMLRIAAIWRGPGVTPVSMSQGSYQPAVWGKKAPEGQGLLPRIDGEPIILNHLFASVQMIADPRPDGPDSTEIARGPLPPEIGEFKAINFTPKQISIEYTLNGDHRRDVFNITNQTIGK